MSDTLQVANTLQYYNTWRPTKTTIKQQIKAAYLCESRY